MLWLATLLVTAEQIAGNRPVGIQGAEDPTCSGCWNQASACLIGELTFCFHVRLEVQGQFRQV